VFLWVAAAAESGQQQQQAATFSFFLKLIDLIDPWGPDRQRMVPRVTVSIVSH